MYIYKVIYICSTNIYRIDTYIYIHKYIYTYIYIYIQVIYTSPGPAEVLSDAGEDDEQPGSGEPDGSEEMQVTLSNPGVQAFGYRDQRAETSPGVKAFGSRKVHTGYRLPSTGRQVA